MGQNISILLVDDREEGLIALQAVLRDSHFNLVMARSGQEALNLLSLNDFAVILLDVEMPGMDGFETANRIKQNASYRYTPIIFVTAISIEDVDHIYRGYEYGGAVDYIFKPFDARILLSKVSVFVDLYLKSKLLEEQSYLIRESARQEKVLRLAQWEVESLKRYQNLANSISDVVWRANSSGSIDYFNQVWVDYTGLTDQLSFGDGWQQAFDQDDLGNFLRSWMKSMEQGTRFQAECRIRNHAGEMRWHWVRAQTERNDAGEVIAWLGTCTDIEDRKYMETKLIEISKEAESASLAKTHFLANMSHEIRTPLNSIIGFTELLMNPEVTLENRMANLAIVKRSGLQLLRIIDEVLDISKVETGRLNIDSAETDLMTIFVDLQSSLKIQAREKGIKLNFVCLNPIPRTIFTDPARYRQILTNVIGNAIKFTCVGTVEVLLSYTTNAETGQRVLHCSVSDTGPGIQANHVERLFQPFMQVDSSATRRFGGAGLGLALSRRLARALKGNVYLESSEPDVGSVFCVDIEAKAVEPVTYFENISSEHIQSSIEKNIFDKKYLQDVAILIVDDANDNRILMEHFLKGVGAKTDFAGDGQEAIDKATSKEFQIVLMDIQMPVLDGYSAAIELRRQGYKKPIIALTAHALKEDRERSIKAGCDDHITKPIDRVQLLKLISQYTNARVTH